MALKMFLNILFSISFLSCTSVDSKNISIKDVHCTSAPILLVNDTSEIFGTKDSAAVFIPICFELQNSTGKDLKFEYHLIGEKDQTYPISQVDDSIFINRNDLNSNNYFELNNKKTQLYTIFYQSDILRSDLNTIQLDNSKKIFETINYIPIDSKIKLEKDNPSLVIHVKFIEENEDFNLYYYTNSKKYLIVDYDAVISYSSEKNDTISALEFAKINVLDYNALSKFSLDNYKQTIDNQTNQKPQ